MLKKRLCYVENHIGKIPLANGKGTALVDEDRLSEVSAYSWCLDGGGYARTSINGVKVYLHRFLYPELERIDHILTDRRDCRSCNLRYVTHAQNMMNRGKGKGNTSGFKGVSYFKRDDSWKAQIKKDKVLIFIGCFPTAEEAAYAYDKKAKELFGEFANLNFKKGKWRR